MEIFTTDFFIFRWLHVLFGIIWIGILYYFNFVQVPSFAEMDGTSKSGAIQKLVPRALWWFRWGAMGTFLMGLYLFYKKYVPAMHDGVFLTSGGGLTITLGALLGTLMFLNVWLIIWPKQKVVIASTTAVAGGGKADPSAADAGARALVASRTNVLFSIPMLFFMMATSKNLYAADPNGSYMTVICVSLVLIAVLELNAIKGKAIGPLKSVNGVIAAGFGLWLVLYGMVHFVSAN